MGSHDTGRLRPIYPELIQVARLIDIGLMGIAMYALAPYWGALDQRHLLLVVFTALVMQLTYTERGVYRTRTRTAAVVSARILQAWLTVLAVLGTIGAIFGTTLAMPAGLLASWAAAAFLLQVAFHLVLGATLRSLRAHGHNVRRVLLVGDDVALIEAFHVHLEKMPTLGFWPLGYVRPATPPDPENPDTLSRLKNLGTPKDVQSLVAQHKIDEVYVITPSLDEEILRRVVLDHLLSLPVSVNLVPVGSILNELNLHPVELGGQLSYRLNESPMQGLPMAFKRAQDIVFSLIFLALLSPLLVGIAAAVKITSPGPILFKQQRHGRGGRIVKVWKFRTMTQSASATDPAQQASLGDPRITPLGAFLRRWSLDELPQLVNVLQGRMSLVGPRPHPVWLDNHFQEEIDAYIQRHRVKPGITGWAQVNGARGETDTLEKMEQRLRYDLYYINNWSFWMDQKILARTLMAVLQGTNAH